MSLFNIDFFRNIRIALDLNLWIPRVEIESIREIMSVIPPEVRGIIFDVDQTILPYGAMSIDDDIVEVLRSLGNRYSCCLLSNIPASESKRTRLNLIQNITGIPALISPTKKPDPKPFLIALVHLNLPPKQVAMIGDRILTDIIGANKLEIYSILVKPINSKSDPLFWVRIPRAIESLLYLIIRKYRGR